MSTAVPTTGRRSRTGCGTCRARKVKCDERPGTCTNCERLDLPCQPASAVVSSRTRAASTAAAPKAKQDLKGQDSSKPAAGEPIAHRRYRTFQSCKACRAAKARCSGEQPECQRCRYRGQQCLYESKAAPQWISRASRNNNPRRSNTAASATGSDADGTAGSKGDNEYEGHDSDSSMSDQGYSDAQISTSKRPSHDSRADAAPALEMSQLPSPMSRTPGGETASTSHSGLARDHWLMSEHLPSYHRLLRLVKEYFRIIHPLRCFGFVHRPSFMQSIEDQTEPERNQNILLLVICALGAKFYAAKTMEKSDTGAWPLHAGAHWGQKALSLLFSTLNNASADTAMAAVLLHEHELRMGNYASAYMITGLAVRLSQALQLNVEPPEYSSEGAPHMSGIALRESRRRLMWAIFVMDAWVGSGVNELTMLNDTKIQVCLPCNEQDFVLEMESHDTSRHGSDPGTGQKRYHQDVAAHFVQLVSIRSRVLHYVKHLDKAQSPWLADSEFATLQSEFYRWFGSLPASLQFTRSAVQKRKVSHQHGALLLMHLTFHQSLCDLTRIGMGDLFRIRAPVTFPPNQTTFLTHVQDLCFDSCMSVSDVLLEALKHGSEALADTWIPVVAHDITRVIVHYTKNKLGSAARHGDARFQARVLGAFSTNLEALRRMAPLNTLAAPLHVGAAKMIRNGGFEMPLFQEGNHPEFGALLDNLPSCTGSPSAQTPEYVLNPLAIYRLARRDIREGEKHTTDASVTSGSGLSPLETRMGGFGVSAERSTQVNPPLESPEMRQYPQHHHQQHQVQSAGQPNFQEGNTGEVSWGIMEPLELPSSFDDLQMYMQLPPDVLASLRVDYDPETAFFPANNQGFQAQIPPPVDGGPGTMGTRDFLSSNQDYGR